MNKITHSILKNLVRNMSFNTRKEIPLKHLFDSSELNVYNIEIALNLGVGAPGQKDLTKCCKIFEQATKHCLAKEQETGAFLFQYGPTAGVVDHRNTLAKFLSDGYQSKVHAEDLILSSGATHGMHLILSTLLDTSNGFIFVDDVTYMIALHVFAQFPNVRVFPVSSTRHGTNIESLENLLKKYQFVSNSKMFWGMYYTIPTFHNPMGILFNEETNQKLIQMARKYDILIACDDVYNLLVYDGQCSPKRLFEYDNFEDVDFKGHVISNGSFSKILAPGIRFGCMECPPRIVDVFRDSGILKSGGCANNYTAGIVSSLIELGLAQEHLNFYIEKYKDGRDALCKELLELPEEVTFTKPAGGYFVWVKFPEHIDCSKFNEFCLKNFKVFGIPGERFSVQGDSKNFLRLSFSFHDAANMAEAGRRLCAAAKEYLSKNST